MDVFGETADVVESSAMRDYGEKSGKAGIGVGHFERGDLEGEKI